MLTFFAASDRVPFGLPNALVSPVPDLIQFALTNPAQRRLFDPR
jgi:hypothetical protein